MKKLRSLLLILALAVAMLTFASCDFQAQIESISEMIYNAATQVGDQFLKEETSSSQEPTIIPSESDSSESSESTVDQSDSAVTDTATDSATDTATDTATDSESTSDTPITPPEPEPVPIPERNPSTFDAMMGTNVDFVLPNRFPATNPLLEHALTNKYFSFVRVYKDFSEGMDEDYEQLALTRASTVYRSRTSLLLDLKFADFVESNPPLPTVYLEDAGEMATAIGDSAIFAEIKAAFTSISEATPDIELTDATGALVTAIENLKTTYASLEGEELSSKVIEIKDAAFAIQDPDMENPFCELFASLALTLDEIVPTPEPTPDPDESETETESEAESTTEAEPLSDVEIQEEPKAELTDDEIIAEVDGAIDTLSQDLEPLLDELEETALKPLPEQKKTYVELAKSIFQYEKAYENQMFGKLRLIEIGRHPDKLIDAASYAKIFSLAYDGADTGATDIGVINANSEAKLVMGAMSAPNSAYVKELMDQISLLRPDETPLFVGAFNTEAFAPSSVTPESVYLSEDSELLKMAQYRDENYNHVELFVSAFGYNTLDSESDFYVTEQKQADYLVRSMLIFSAIGVDSASICQLKDAEGSEYNGFGTITAENTAKIASYYLSTTKTVLEGYTFNAVVENAQGAMVYEFIDTDSNKIYAVWNATDSDAVIDDVLVSVGDSDGITVTELVSEYGEGSKSDLVASEGFVSVRATATPKFIHVPAQIVE